MSSGPRARDSDTTWSDRDWGIAHSKVAQIFNPTSPIDQDRLFVGRITQVADLLSVIYRKGAHAILFGERGVGKSSLANTIKEKIPSAVANYRFLKENCRPEDTFFSIWAKLLWDFEYEGRRISDILENETRHFVVIKILEALQKETQFVLILDEFDRVKADNTKAAMADTIKHFSDYPQNITIVIVGVGFSVEELFGAHPSVARCCQPIAMPRMSQEELSDIILPRYQEIGLSIRQANLSSMTETAQGLPGYAHLIAAEAANAALGERTRNVGRGHYDIAIRESVRLAQEPIVNAYGKAVYSPRDNIYRQVLLACALSRSDDRGRFSASDVKAALSKILKKPVEISYFARHLAAFCDDDRGPVLRKLGKPKRFQYQFIDAPLQPFIVMKGKTDGLI